MIERLSGASYESVEDFVQNSEYDDYSKGEMYNYGDFYVYITGFPLDTCNAYVYFDYNCIIRVKMYNKEDETINKEHYSNNNRV